MSKTFIRSIDFFEKSSLSFGFFAKVIILSAKSIEFATFVNIPYFPFSSISFGPVLQSVEIIGMLQASASIKTVGSPSCREESTKIFAYDIYL